MKNILFCTDPVSVISCCDAFRICEVSEICNIGQYIYQKIHKFSFLHIGISDHIIVNK